MNNKKVSIIVPVYNAENYLKQCLDSIVNQTYKNIEIICINDASTDNSLSILKEYEENDKRIKILSGEHIGAGKARNLGIENSNGDYLLFLDCDDFFELNMVEEMLNKIINENSDIAICESIVFDNVSGDIIKLNNGLSQHFTTSPINPQNYPEDLFTYIDGCAWNKMFKATMVKENAVFFEDLTSCNDVTFTYTMLALAKSISIINKQLVHYRTNQKNNISANRGDKAINGIFAVIAIKKNLKTYNLYDVYRNTFYRKTKGIFLNELSYCSQKQKQFFIKSAKKFLPQDLLKIFMSAVGCNPQKKWEVKLFSIIPFLTITQKGAKNTINLWGIPLFKIKVSSYRIKIYFCGIPILKASIKQ